MAKQTINVSWPTVPGATVYDLENIDPSGLSHISSTKATTAKFGVFQGSAIKIRARPVVPPTPPAVKPQYRCHIMGQNRDGLSDVTSKSATWVVHDSPNREVGTKPYADHRALIRWDPGHIYEGRKTFVVWTIWPGQGTCGRSLNFHNSTALPGGWDWGGGVSCLALDFVPVAQKDDKGGGMYEGLVATVEPTGSSIEKLAQQYHFTLVPLTEWNRGGPLEVVLEIGWGNVNMLATPGSLKATVNGTVRLDKSAINTHFYLDYHEETPGQGFGPNPGGGQRGISLWTGGYVTPSAGYPASEIGSYAFAAPLVGRTEAEARAEKVVEFSHSSQDTQSTANGPHSYTEVL